MHLLETAELRLYDFVGSNVPLYAILSHCWSQDPEQPEVTYQQLVSECYLRESYGWEKVRKCCAIAKARGRKWAWVDTCCIDKTSSAELSEAINSMYSWYRNAEECYVFLDDVVAIAKDFSYGTTTYLAEPDDFCASRWFLRGWTLQELLAPQQVYFYDKDRNLFASRATHYDLITRATRIPSEYLLGQKPTDDACVAQRMSWAARRQTTRIENQAYALLGLFRVNMPLLYGERDGAFLRLQLEILRQSDDLSIFVWGVGDVHSDLAFGVLAESPSRFRTSGSICSVPSPMTHTLKPMHVTNKGTFPYNVSLSRMMDHNALIGYDKVEVAPINIHLPYATELECGSRGSLRLSIKRASHSEIGWSQYARIAVNVDTRSALGRFPDNIPVFEDMAYITYTRGEAQRDKAEPGSRSLRALLLWLLALTTAGAAAGGVLFVHGEGKRMMFPLWLLILALDLAKRGPVALYVVVYWASCSMLHFVHSLLKNEGYPPRSMS